MSSAEVAEGGESQVFRVQSVRGEMDARATQITPTLENINSHDVFILGYGSGVIVWNGSDCNAEEAKEAVRLAGQLFSDIIVVVVRQGEEPEEFWTILGAEAGSAIGDGEGVTGPVLSPRLFHVTAKRAWEIHNFKRSVTFLDQSSK